MNYNYTDAAVSCQRVLDSLPPVNIAANVKRYGAPWLRDKTQDREIAAAILTRLIKGTWPDMLAEVKDMATLRLVFTEEMCRELAALHPEEEMTAMSTALFIASTCTSMWHRGAAGNKWILEKLGIMVDDYVPATEQEDAEAVEMMTYLREVANKLTA